MDTGTGHCSGFPASHPKREVLKKHMRPGQQNKRSRGRSGRKNVNPLSRNYESNGPDVKVRGNASHIADKYVQLARDATASGDLIMAENYLQHAEHYFRVISAAQAQQQQQRQDQQPNPDSSDGDDGEDGRRMNGHAQGEPSDGETARKESAEATPDGGDGEQRPRRGRRPSRRNAESGDGDLAGAPQPNLNGASQDEPAPKSDEPAAAE